MQKIHDPKTFDYIGLIGKQVDQLDEVSRDAWRRVRDWMVSGHPVNDLPKRSKQVVTGRIQRNTWQSALFDNLPKPRWLKTRWPQGVGKTAFNPYENMVDHSLDSPFAFLRNHAIQLDCSDLEKRFAEFEEGIEKTRESMRLNPRMPILGFRDSMLNGGLAPGQWPAVHARPWHAQPHQMMMLRRLQELGKPVVVSLEDSEAQPDWEELIKKLNLTMFDSISPMTPKRSTGMRVVRTKMRPTVNSDYHFDFEFTGRFDFKFAALDDESFAPLYEKERKKYKHKDAVNRILKRYRGDRKEAALSLERVGAAYEKEFKAKKNADKSAE